MSRRDPQRTRSRFWRVVAIVFAACSGLAAVCLVVFGTSQKQLQVGVLLGLWGAFLAFGSRWGQPDPAVQAAQLAEAELRTSQLHEAQLQVSQLQHAQLEATHQTHAAQEVELRRFGELQLAREAAARRAADLNLEISLRREIERMMSEQLGALREEVAALRAEVVDKLGGQLRLERIETTRLIGSDLEALQHEIRRLAGGQDSLGTGPSAIVATGGAAERSGDSGDRAGQGGSGHGDAGHGGFAGGRPRGGSGSDRPAPPHDIIDAEVVDSVPGRSAEPSAPSGGLGARSGGSADPAAQVSEAAVPAFAPAAQPSVAQTADRTAELPTEPPVAKGDWSAPTVVEQAPTVAADQPVTAPRTREAVAVPVLDEPADAAPITEIPPAPRQSERVAAFSSTSDPFADLPRLSPLPADVELIHDPVPAPVLDSSPDRGPDGSGHHHPDDTGGRRRAPDPEPAPDSDRYQGRRRADGAPADGEASETEIGRRHSAQAGRRRAPDDAPDDLLAKVLDR